MPKTLVVFFSRTGHTRRIAERLARALGADLDVIREARSRLGLGGYLRSGYEATFKRESAIEPTGLDPAGYDLVIIGTPVWNYSLSSPVRAYLHQHRDVFKAVAFFLTEGGTGQARVFGQMTEVVGKLPLGTLTIRESELEETDLDARVDAFAKKLIAELFRRPVRLAAPAA